MAERELLEKLESVINDLSRMKEATLYQARLLDGEIQLKSSFESFRICDDERKHMISLLTKSEKEKEKAAIFKQQRKNIVEIKKILASLL